MGELTVIGSTGGGHELPVLIGRAGDRAARRFIEFFTVNIRNRNTRAAYARAAAVFLRWCEGQGIARLQNVKPVHVAAYIEQPGNSLPFTPAQEHGGGVSVCRPCVPVANIDGEE